jgi:hypothetical protein
MIRTSIDEIVVWVSGTGPDTFPKCVLFMKFEFCLQTIGAGKWMLLNV